MTTFHAVVWMDHQEAHVLMFDREHVESQRVKSRSHHKHQGKPNEVAHLYADIAKALEGTHEVLVTGPGSCERGGQHRQRPPHRRTSGGHGSPVLQEV
jgi:stalled ribosome rescue protein Dom34